jgi:hypothetical protein
VCAGDHRQQLHAAAQRLVLDWSALSVVVAEKGIPNIKTILQGISLGKYVAMHTWVKRLQRHFLWHPKPVNMTSSI